ncbi:MAG: cyclic nucleotide-binding domain-containing protein [Dehalococcoidia bacterium]|nr:cyclic nucleotide-binding domain-containing protein [Dehalococcoidia bacterium]
MELHEALSKSKLFAGLSQAELDRVVKLCTGREYQPQTMVFDEGGAAKEVYLLEQGRVALEMKVPSISSAAHRRATVDIASEGDVFGWSALVEPYTYTLSAICLEKVKAIALDAAGLRDLLEQNERIGYQVSKGLVRVVSSRLTSALHLLIGERAWPG